MRPNTLIITKILNIVFVLLLLISGIDAYSQITFEKTFGNALDMERGYCVKQTYDAGYIVVGTNSGDETGSENIMLIKTDSSGNQLWSKSQFDFSLWQCYATSLKITPDSGFIITGGSVQTSGIYDVFLLKTDQYGNQQWVKTYDSIQSNPSFGIIFNERGLDVIPTSDNGFLVTGVASYEEFILKTDSIGNIQWLTKDTGLHRAVGNSLIEAENNNYLVLGYTTSNLSNTWKMYLTKFNAFGNKIWGKTYNWSQGDYSLGYSVKVSTNGEYLLLGQGRYNGSQYGEMLLIKTDTAGNVIWEHSFLKNNYSSGWSLDVTSDNGYILTGEAFDLINGYEIYLVKTDSSGNLQWDTTYSGDWGYSVQQTLDNGYIITGVKLGDVYLLKTNSNGLLLSLIDDVSSSSLIYIYPNPSIGNITIELNSGVIRNYDITIHASDGKNYNSIRNLKANEKIVISEKEFCAGINILKFISDSKILDVRKILILR